MPIANGSERRVASIAEVTYGTTPATPTFLVKRITGGGLRNNKQTGVSDEIRADRNVSDEFMLGITGSGAYDAELSYGSHDDWIEAMLGGTWTTNVLKNGVIQRSFTIEETYELGTTDMFSRFTGCSPNSMSLSLEAGAKASMSFDWMAQKETTAAAAIASSTYTAANTKDIMTASRSVASLTILGSSYKVSSLNLEVNNNLRERPVIGSLYSEQFGQGRCEVTGSFEVYLEAATLYDSMLAHGSGALSFTIGDTTAEKYTFSLPKIRLLDGEKNAGGNNDDVMMTIPFRALFDTSAACSIQITRAVT